MYGHCHRYDIYAFLLLVDLPVFWITNLPSLRTPTEDLASDAAIAWLLSLDQSPESPADSRSRRGFFRAEARSRVQERRQREEEMEEMCLEEKLIEIWGLYRMSAVYILSNAEYWYVMICNDEQIEPSIDMLLHDSVMLSFCQGVGAMCWHGDSSCVLTSFTIILLYNMY